MFSSIRNSSLTILLVMLAFNTSKAQTAGKANSNNRIALKFSSYTIEQNTLINKEFSKIDGYKIAYTCIPAGIVLVESDKFVTPQEKDFVSKKIDNTKEKLHYQILDGYSQEQAEQACSGIRNSKNSNTKLD